MHSIIHFSPLLRNIPDVPKYSEKLYLKVVKTKKTSPWVLRSLNIKHGAQETISFRKASSDKIQQTRKSTFVFLFHIIQNFLLTYSSRYSYLETMILFCQEPQYIMQDSKVAYNNCKNITLRKKQHYI